MENGLRQKKRELDQVQDQPMRIDQDIREIKKAISVLCAGQRKLLNLEHDRACWSIAAKVVEIVFFILMLIGIIYVSFKTFFGLYVKHILPMG